MGECQTVAENENEPENRQRASDTKGADTGLTSITVNLCFAAHARK